ncbi:hypothetical protein LPJ53_002458 [Coemansia erecta]|uniref:SWR1-complex protein 5 n=1 Tax=Coemansia erecta TaxID=147472 RepID=A0A9W7XY65_9FUNG|nr:hypothetical protein LPJ53_002458 [Coemansia erecta]
MSLADLYRDDNTHDDDSDEGSEDEFVPEGGDSDDQDGSDAGSDSDDNGGSTGAKEPVGPTAEELEEQKRKIDDIWKEMNAPINTRDSPSASLETKASSESPEKPETSDKQDASKLDENGRKPAEEGESEKGREEGKTPPRRAAAAGGTKRKASKFSQLAEMAEQRRIKRENTLDIARKEWTGFVAKEGIREDLDRANKDGYVERQEFLRRVDERTYEKAREHRK